MLSILSGSECKERVQIVKEKDLNHAQIDGHCVIYFYIVQIGSKFAYACGFNISFCIFRLFVG
jgi:hypothetical protein